MNNTQVATLEIVASMMVTVKLMEVEFDDAEDLRDLAHIKKGLKRIQRLNAQGLDGERKRRGPDTQA